MRVPIHPQHPEPRKIAKAVDALRRGEIVAFPTDTMYGIGCEIHEKKALERIYQLKGMPKDRQLSFICPDLGDIAKYAFVSDRAYRIMKRLLPGPYTFVLRATRDVPRTLMMKRKTVGIRIPDHPVPLALVRELGSPLISTSTTWQGEALVDPDEIDARFPGMAMVLDADWGGSEPSTVVDLSGDEPEVLRHGAGVVDFM